MNGIHVNYSANGTGCFDKIGVTLPVLPSEWLELENKISNNCDEIKSFKDKVDSENSSRFSHTIISDSLHKLHNGTTGQDGLYRERVRNIYEYLIEDKTSLEYTDADLRYESMHSLSCDSNVDKINTDADMESSVSLLAESKTPSDLIVCGMDNSNMTTPKVALQSPCEHEKCQESFNQASRHAIFYEFWLLNTDQKLQYFYKHIKRKVPSTIGQKSSNRPAFKFYLTQENQTLEVCRKFFLHTLAIDKTKILNFYKNLEVVNASEARISNQPPCAEQNLTILKKFNQIRDHIRSYAVVGSECKCKVNGNSAQKYLQFGVNMRKMYESYRKSVDDPLGTSMYRKIFNEEFKYRFIYPKKHRKDCKLLSGNEIKS